MRFVHIADTHLGFSAFNKLDPDTGMNLRERLFYDNFLESVREIVRQRPEVVVHAGDLFDRVRPKTRAYTTVLEALELLKDAGIPLVAISGNHSMPKTRYTPSPFEVLEFHAADMHAAYRYRYERVEIGDVTFHLIPNMLHAEDYQEAFDDLAWSASGANVLVTHGLASVLRDWRLRTVAEHELSATMLSPDFDYIALGHFHGQRQVAENAWYSGSLEFCSYAEIADTKGGLLVDTSSGEVRHLPLPHTPMVDLGTVRCEGKDADEVNGRVSRILDDDDLDATAMYLLTLDKVARDVAGRLDQKKIAQIRDRVLNLKIKVGIAEESTPAFEGKDVAAVDFVEEFSRFLARKELSPEAREFVQRKGTLALRHALERHAEAPE
jgi:exonuclease SbcD